MKTHGELFAGIGGFGIGADRAGMKTLWHVEIDKNAQSVLRKQFPGVQIESDVREVGKHNLCPVDVISFGSPCQDLSIAGKRRGLQDGTRSNLFYEAIRIIRELNTPIAIWENVPGALSSNRGKDFRSVLAEMLNAEVPMPKSGRWATAGMVRTGQTKVAWRILDSQYFGVAQRRRRVFVVRCTGNISATEILFEPQSSAGNTPPSREGREGTAARTSEPIVMAHGQANAEILNGMSPTLNVNHEQPLIAWEMQHASEVYRETQGGIAPTLQSRMGTGGNQVPMVGVRRLTPLECERLQGFPDGWTEGQSDSARYKQLGNAVAVPVVEWIMRRINNEEKS